MTGGSDAPSAACMTSNADSNRSSRGSVWLAKAVLGGRRTFLLTFGSAPSSSHSLNSWTPYGSSQVSQALTLLSLCGPRTDCPPPPSSRVPAQASSQSPY